MCLSIQLIVNIQILTACCDFTHGHVSVLTVSLFIAATIHENPVNDLNQRHKGLGGAARAKETSATETKVENAIMGIGTPSRWGVPTNTSHFELLLS